MTSFMVGRGNRLRWGIEASAVLAVERVAERGGGGMELEVALGLEAVRATKRILEIQSGGQAARVTVSGYVEIVDVSPDRVLRLPELVRRESARLLSAVIISEDAPPILVVDRERLVGHALRRG